jgi:hypothetical protein
MNQDRIEAYLRALERALWLRGLADADTLAEIESHLRESVEQGQLRGLSLEEAERQALERFGPVKLVASTFEKERKDTMQSILLAVAVLAGLFSAWVDARPTWDDTGILVGGLLLVSGLLTLLGGRRPWLIALAVGIWIPVHDIYLSHDPRMLVVLLIPFVGAYAGWAVRPGVRKMLHLA